MSDAIARDARRLCGDQHQDGPAGCPTCRILETRLQPVSTLSPLLADAGLTFDVRRGAPGTGEPQDSCNRWCEHGTCAVQCTARCVLRPMHRGDCVCTCRGGGVAQTLLDVMDRANAIATQALRQAIARAAARRLCDCGPPPHRWDCHLTPIWTQTVLDLGALWESQ